MGLLDIRDELAIGETLSDVSTSLASKYKLPTNEALSTVSYAVRAKLEMIDFALTELIDGNDPPSSTSETKEDR